MREITMFCTVLKEFRQSEDGAVTVDFVVLTAMIVVLGVAVITIIGPRLNPAISGVNPALAAAPGLGASILGTD